jgi:hypothetical protein
MTRGTGHRAQQGTGLMTRGTGHRAQGTGRVQNELGGGGGFLARLQDCKTARPRAASR